MTQQSRLEIWTNIGGGMTSDPLGIANRAVKLEAEGWDGGTVVDSECIAVEPYVTLTLCANRSKTFKLGTGVTNPVTRHPAVTAAAIATLQIASGNRVELGIGRGDSSLAYLGASPMPIGRFEQALKLLQSYLRGDTVPLEEAAAVLSGTEKGFDKLTLAKAPPGSWLKWLPKDYQKVPLDVAATGPRAIGVAARVAERVSFVVGANVERLKWGLETARQAAEEAGRDPATLKFSAWLMVHPHENIEVSRRLVSGGVSGMSRFLIMNKKIAAPVSDAERRTLERLAGAYDMATHSQGGAQAQALDSEFIDSFAILGDPAHCLERVQEIAALGFHRLHLLTALPELDQGRESHAMVVDEILPVLKGQ